MGSVVSKGEIRQSVMTRPLDDIWQATLDWTRTLSPFWLGAIERFALVAAVPDERRARLTVAAEAAFDRMDD